MTWVGGDGGPVGMFGHSVISILSRISNMCQCMFTMHRNNTVHCWDLINIDFLT